MIIDWYKKSNTHFNRQFNRHFNSKIRKAEIVNYLQIHNVIENIILFFKPEIYGIQNMFLT